MHINSSLSVSSAISSTMFPVTNSARVAFKTFFFIAIKTNADAQSIRDYVATVTLTRVSHTINIAALQSTQQLIIQCLSRSLVKSNAKVRIYLFSFFSVTLQRSIEPRLDTRSDSHENEIHIESVLAVDSAIS